jgi:hypothetical protein
VRIRVLRVECDRLGDIGHGLVVRAAMLVSGRVLVIGGDIFGIELDGLREIGNGAHVIALVRLGEAAAQEGRTEFPEWEPQYRFSVAFGSALASE